MKLSFHGGKYEKEELSSVEVREGEIGGTYRGSPWKVHKYQIQYRCRQFPKELTYRGITYRR